MLHSCTTAQLQRLPSDERLGSLSMKTMLRNTGLIVAGFMLVFAVRAGADSGTSPDFQEVRSVLLEHLAGTTEAQLNQAAVKGLLGELKGRVTLLSDSDGPATNSLTLLASERLFDSEIGYVRVRNVGGGLDEAIASAATRLADTNKLVGLVLDLRYAKGEDYVAAANAVDLFLPDEVPLLNAGKGLVRSKKKDNAMKLPVVALVNHETTAAAEALAAMLRQTGVGLLIGSTTAGRAGVTADYELSTGQSLRVVTAPVQLGDAKPVPASGVVPDVEIETRPSEEAVYYDDPYANLDRSSNGESKLATADGEGVISKRVRVTEADLVREKRGDGDLETLAGARATSEERPPKVSDPALARAIDLLKGLSVVRQWKL